MERGAGEDGADRLGTISQVTIDTKPSLLSKEDQKAVDEAARDAATIQE